ncbi:sulfotransferase family protein [Roseomonas eburnea]|uniref:Sulfotransferase family protein n=1 Tax=Neoroseomonas eburnea TaxID=1346889 RepID=A0A9X9X9A3_9PROT|nr:hypothetical protein [Neoroseomonas eburnea]MBR0680289.1 sulfotransferase family protein [Neoroseomonas eburnea]
MPPEYCRPADPDMRLVFIHVPKTGGTSLHAALARHFAPESVVHAIAPASWGDALSPASRIRYISGHTRFSAAALMPRPHRIATVLCEPVERLLSLYTFWRRHRDNSLPELREAVEKDLLGFLRSPEPLVRAAIDNAMARQLYGAALIAPDGRWFTPISGCGTQARLPEQEVLAGALENLAVCDAVGVMDDLPALYRQICAELAMTPGPEPGRLNTRDDVSPGLREAPPPEPLTPEIRRELDRLTRLDRIVYEAARIRAAGGSRTLRPAAGDPPRGPAWLVDPVAFVDIVFRSLFGRPPEPNCLTVHAVALAEGAMMPAEMIRLFVDTGEFRSRQAAAAQP